MGVPLRSPRNDDYSFVTTKVIRSACLATIPTATAGSGRCDQRNASSRPRGPTAQRRVWPGSLPPVGRGTRGGAASDSSQAPSWNSRAQRADVDRPDGSSIVPACRANTTMGARYNAMRLAPQPTDPTERLRISAAEKRGHHAAVGLPGGQRHPPLAKAMRPPLLEVCLRAVRERLCASLLILLSAPQVSSSYAGDKRSLTSRHADFRGSVMCGAQGWLRAEANGSGEGWKHDGHGSQLGPDYVTVDRWPDTSENAETYKTPFTLKYGEQARAFSSPDARPPKRSRTQ